MCMLYFKEFPDINADQTIKECNEYFDYKYKSLDFEWPWHDIENFDEFLTRVPSIRTLFKPLNLTPKFAAFFIILVNDPCIHIDGATTSTSCRINLPVRNCEYSETTFYNLKDNISIDRVLGEVSIVPEDVCDMVAKVSLKHPTALAVGQYHSVRMIENVFPRISITIGFEEDTSHLLFGRSGEIRTHGAISDSTVFKTVGIIPSPTLP